MQLFVTLLCIYTIEQGDSECEIIICLVLNFQLSVGLTFIESGIDLGIYRKSLSLKICGKVFCIYVAIYIYT